MCVCAHVYVYVCMYVYSELAKVLEALAPVVAEAEEGAQAPEGDEEGQTRQSEELLSALLLQGAAVGYARVDDRRAERLLGRVVSLSEQWPTSSFADPFHLPFAVYELGLCHTRGRRHKEALASFKRCQKIEKKRGFSFDRALRYRAQAHGNAVCTMLGLEEDADSVGDELDEEMVARLKEAEAASGD